jgi:serine/threonine-protein kinase RsbW
MTSLAGHESVAVVGHRFDRAGAARLRFALTLPRVATSVPSVRALLDAALTLMGVAEKCRGEVAVALTEACANAIVHALGSDGYTVGVTLSGDRCVIGISDTGVGMDPGRLDGAGPGRLADRGRGLLLMRRCMDTVEIRSVHPRGIAVRMCKDLTYAV